MMHHISYLNKIEVLKSFSSASGTPKFVSYLDKIKIDTETERNVVSNVLISETDDTRYAKDVEV
jgi:hypothetical protein